jgi:hypothetical protein
MKEIHSRPTDYYVENEKKEKQEERAQRQIRNMHAETMMGASSSLNISDQTESSMCSVRPRPVFARMGCG